MCKLQLFAHAILSGNAGYVPKQIGDVSRGSLTGGMTQSSLMYGNRAHGLIYRDDLLGRYKLRLVSSHLLSSTLSACPRFKVANPE